MTQLDMPSDATVEPAATERSVRIRFNDAVEQLGSRAFTARIAGAYSLAELVHVWAREGNDVERQICVQVLCGYLRTQTLSPRHSDGISPPTTPDREQREEVQVRTTLVEILARGLARNEDLSSFYREYEDENVAYEYDAGVFVEWAGCSIGLRGADLANSVLTNVRLSNADLHGADLTGALLSQADLADADLGEAHLVDAFLDTARLVDSTLTYADLTNANLYHADLTNASCGEANFSGANLWRAILVGADLSDCSFVGARLLAADLTGANLSRANLSGADLTRAVLGDTDFTSARYTQDTVWREGKPAAGAILVEHAE